MVRKILDMIRSSADNQFLVMRTISLGSSMEEELRAKAHELKVSKNQVMRALLRYGLDALKIEEASAESPEAKPRLIARQARVAAAAARPAQI